MRYEMLEVLLYDRVLRNRRYDVLRDYHVQWFPVIARRFMAMLAKPLCVKAAVALLHVVVACLPLAVSDAQAVLRATPSDSDLVAANFLSRSFKGIHLSKADSLLAARVVKREFQTSLKLNGTLSDEALSQIDAMYERRDAALLALLRTAVDSALYLRNTASFTPPRRKTSAKP